MTEKKNKKRKPEDPRVFLTAAYLVEEEPKTFCLYRNMEQEVIEKGVKKREKLGKPLGPIGIFRECEGQEKPDLRTVHPSTGKELLLKCISKKM